MTGGSVPHWRASRPTAGPAHVVWFGAQVDVKGIISPSRDAERAGRYLRKSLTKSVAATYPCRRRAADRCGVRGAHRAPAPRGPVAALYARVRDGRRGLADP